MLFDFLKDVLGVLCGYGFVKSALSAFIHGEKEFEKAWLTKISK